ncbi:MAG: hypothetical protein R6V76_12820 [Desulfobacterales bacterium]
MLRPKRKKRLSDFSGGKNYPVFIILSAFFTCGLLISYKYSLTGIALYFGLWIISYFTIYAGTCRYCVYHGKKCPVPLEGSCAHHFFDKKENGFGNSQFFWAAMAYILRIILPVVIIFRKTLYVYGIIYFGLFITYWVVHLFCTGCPNCTNGKCPLNPDY